MLIEHRATAPAIPSASEHLALERRQPGDHGGLDRLPAQVVQRGLVDDVVLEPARSSDRKFRRDFDRLVRKTVKGPAQDLFPIIL